MCGSWPGNSGSETWTASNRFQRTALRAAAAQCMPEHLVGAEDGRATERHGSGTFATDGVSFDGVDMFQFDDAGLISRVRAFWERSSLHRHNEP